MQSQITAVNELATAMANIAANYNLSTVMGIKEEPARGSDFNPLTLKPREMIDEETALDNENINRAANEFLGLYRKDMSLQTLKHLI